MNLWIVVVFPEAALPILVLLFFLKTQQKGSFKERVPSMMIFQRYGISDHQPHSRGEEERRNVNSNGETNLKHQPGLQDTYETTWCKRLSRVDKSFAA